MERDFSVSALLTRGAGSLWSGGCRVRGKMFSNTLGLEMPAARPTPTPFVTMKNVFRRFQQSLVGPHHAWLRTPALEDFTYRLQIMNIKGIN